MGFYIDREPKRVIRTRAKLRAALSRLALVHDRSGNRTAPITLPCTYVDLCKLGLTPIGGGQFLFQSHPVFAFQAPCNGSVPSRDPAKPEQLHAVVPLWRREPVGVAETGCPQDAGGMYSAQDLPSGARRAEARRREGLAAPGLVPRTSSVPECKPDPVGGTR